MYKKNTTHKKNVEGRRRYLKARIVYQIQDAVRKVRDKMKKIDVKIRTLNKKRYHKGELLRKGEMTVFCKEPGWHRARYRDGNSKDSQRKDTGPGDKSKRFQRKNTSLLRDDNSKLSERKDTVSAVEMSTWKRVRKRKQCLVRDSNANESENGERVCRRGQIKRDSEKVHSHYERRQLESELEKWHRCGWEMATTRHSERTLGLVEDGSSKEGQRKSELWWETAIRKRIRE